MEEIGSSRKAVANMLDDQFEEKEAGHGLLVPSKTIGRKVPSFMASRSMIGRQDPHQGHHGLSRYLEAEPKIAM